MAEGKRPMRPIKLRRGWDIFKAYFSVSFKELEIYDKDFIFGVVAMIIEYIVGILSIFFIFDYIDLLNGWSLSEMLFLYGLNLIGYSLWSSFFINTITLPYYIQRGEFDRLLLRPIAPIIQVMLDGFNDDSWGELLTGLIVFAISWITLDISPLYLLILPIIFLSSCLIYAATSILLSTVSFFTVAKADVANLTMEIKEFAQYPISIYPKVLQFIFTFILPIACVSFIPSAVLFGKLSPWYIPLILIGSLLFFGIAVYIWNKGVKHYGSTGT